MKFSTSAVAAAMLVGAFAQNVPSCGVGQAKCPEEYPCCSVDGTCGNGYVCLGGCDVRFSNTPGSCMPMPVCQSGTTKFTSNDQVAAYADYMGDSSKNAWSYLGNITVENNALRAQLYKNGPGTTISSSNYVWYGKITVTMKTSTGAGVVSDFILLSDVKDEIDYEFVGNNLNAAQTNFYWQGALNYSNGVSEGVSSDTNANSHQYTIDWQEDQITWDIDGTTVRTLKKSDTYNSTSQTYSFPQTPARIQFGLWPAGDSAAEGTSQWAGGSIDWSAPDLSDPGYLWAEFSEIDVQCYDPPSSAKVSGSKAYVYTDAAGLESDVEITDDSTILESTDGTGTNPQGSLKNSSSSSDAAFTISGVSTSASSSVAVISGVSSSNSSSDSAPTIDGASFASTSAATTSGAGSSSGSRASDAESSSEPTASEASASAAGQSSSASRSASSSSSGAKSNSGVVPTVGLVALLGASLAYLM